jgi:hypothetical protein
MFDVNSYLPKHEGNQLTLRHTKAWPEFLWVHACVILGHCKRAMLLLMLLRKGVEGAISSRLHHELEVC